MPSQDEIEAAAEAGYENGRSKWHYPKYQITYTDGSPWDDLTKDAKDWYMDNAKAALIAAEAVRNRDTDRDNTGPTIEDGWTQETAPKLAPEESDASGVARSLVIALQAALPHLEAAGDARIKELEEALDDQRKGWDESMAAVEAETLAKVRERVKGQRIEARSLRLDAYNAGIEIAVKAIDREGDG